MIFCAIGIGFLILGVVFHKTYRCALEILLYQGGLVNAKKYEAIATTAAVLYIGSFVISSIIIAICSILIVSANVCGELEIEKAKDQRSTYISLLKENKDITEQDQLYKDITEYNSELKANKYFSKSLWTNWFFAKGWDELEYIEISDYNTQEE